MDANLKPIEENKYSPDNQKTNLFVSQKLDVSEKDKRYKTKQDIQFISFKMPFFIVKCKKKFFLILILMKEDGQKKKGILLLKDLYYMVPIGKN